MSKHDNQNPRTTDGPVRIETLNVDRWVTPFRLAAPMMTIACWTDLLGFGEQLRSARWKLSSPFAEVLVGRLERLSALLRQFSLPHEQVVFINDGLVRTLSPFTYLPGDNQSANVRQWLQNCLMSHCMAACQEHELGLPGIRTVICEGDVLAYHSDGHGNEAFKRMPEPGYLFYPVSIQLNTALSKCYIADSLGSKAGLKRGGFYMETAVLDKLIEIHGAQLVDDAYLFLTGQPLLRPSAKYRCQSGVFHLSTADWKKLDFIEDRAFWLELSETIPISTKDLTFQLREVVALITIE